MKTNLVNALIDDFLYTFRLFRRKLITEELKNARGDITPPLLAIMAHIKEEGPLPISEIGRHLFIPRPQMTILLDKLASLGLIERLPDAEDRRVINISLTAKGVTATDRLRKLVRDNFRKKLSCLNEHDLEQLVAALATLRDIGARIE